LSGNIAAVCVTSGPGGTNAITGVLGGWLDSIPMLVISGQVKFETTVRSTDLPLRQLGDQEFDITSCVKTMTKYADMVTDPYDIRYCLEKALYLAMNGRKGPCWLDIPLNVQGAVIETNGLKKYDPSEDARELPPPIGDKTVQLVLEKLKARGVLLFWQVRRYGLQGRPKLFTGWWIGSTYLWSQPGMRTISCGTATGFRLAGRARWATGPEILLCRTRTYCLCSAAG
jgi:TPP-dependent 2-oxoacid decarboxylase